ncbi:hypothetical protein CHELA1G11_13359 [Hyphomicrobiales bacterium]|nr:hypothetical protein CHELA1G2_10956 [Hyphomicrobiales bacterium]CAH1671112.1 hypothetical protein CHELA1G11_13359 [Hyphomicrobiales bacterium]
MLASVEVALACVAAIEVISVVLTIVKAAPIKLRESRTARGGLARRGLYLRKGKDEGEHGGSAAQPRGKSKIFHWNIPSGNGGRA